MLAVNGLRYRLLVIRWHHGKLSACLAFDSNLLICSSRMGASPKASATKSTGETWDVGHLYVADSSLFPTALGVNPMLTIEAMALHVSRHIVDSLSNTKMAAKI